MQKSRITGSLQFFALCFLAYFTAVKSQIMHEHQSQRIVKLVRVSSFSLCHYHHVIRYIWPLFQFALILAYFWSFLSHICKLWMHWRRVCLKSTRVPSDTTLRRSLVTIKPGLGHYFTWIMSISFNSMHFLLWTDCERSTRPGTWLSLNSFTFLKQIIPASHGKIFWPL